MQSIQTLNALSHAIANIRIIWEYGCLGTVSWFVFKTLMHSCYFCVMLPGVILGLRGSMLNGMTNVGTITSSSVWGTPSAPHEFFNSKYLMIQDRTFYFTNEFGIRRLTEALVDSTVGLCIRVICADVSETLVCF